jgi:hypothetical protein
MMTSKKLSPRNLSPVTLPNNGRAPLCLLRQLPLCVPVRGGPTAAGRPFPHGAEHRRTYDGPQNCHAYAKSWTLKLRQLPSNNPMDLGAAPNVDTVQS